jgi:hypothetical protein
MKALRDSIPESKVAFRRASGVPALAGPGFFLPSAGTLKRGHHTAFSLFQPIPAYFNVFFCEADFTK